MAKRMSFSARKCFSIFFGVAVGAVLILTASPRAIAGQIIEGCTMGTKDVDDQDYPRQALGRVPDRIVNWELVFQKGKYNVRIASRYEFIPFIYKKIRGKYQWAGLSRRTSFKNDRRGNAYFYYNFFANHLSSIEGNFWLLQIKPVPEAQHIRHRVRLIVRPVSCPGEPPAKPPCPPGYRDRGLQTKAWGQSNCVKISP